MFGFKSTKINTDSTSIKTIMTRGVDEIIDVSNLEKKLKSGKQLRVKLGIDPTSPNIHIGRSIPLLKLKDFQDLGHKIIFIIGDFTGVIGDTSDKESERPMLTSEQVAVNMKNYINQAAKIIDINKCEIHYNSKWLKKISYAELGKQADTFSLSDFISRENIKKRLDSGKRVSLRELLYPLMQGYDSVAVCADVEIGGTDQRFNLLAGRELQRLYKQEPQEIITNPLIEGLDGRKMSSSWGNTINLFDSPNDMFGKIMSLSDQLIIKYFQLTTRVSLEKIEEYKTQLDNEVNPKDIKLNLAKEVVRIYHGDSAAESAYSNFENTFSKGGVSDDVVEVSVKQDKSFYDVLAEYSLVSSKTEFRRLLNDGAITNVDNDEKVVFGDSNQLATSGTYKIGKRRFIKIKII